MTRIKITSEGNSSTTRIVDLDSGVDISDRVMGLEWKCGAGELARATVVLLIPHLDAVIEDATLIERCPHCGHERAGAAGSAGSLTETTPMASAWVEYCSPCAPAGKEG